MYKLLHWPGTNRWLPYCTGWKGLPLANTARPADHWYASSAVHSEREVGLDSAKMIGRWLMRAIASMTLWLKAFATVLTPTIMVGLSDSIAATKSLVDAC